MATPVHLAFSYDEEVGCLGVRRLLSLLEGLPVRPAMCIVGEPTSMRFVVGHKGKQACRVRVRGHECHSSLAPQGVNAVDYAAELVVFIRALARSQADQGRQDEGYEVPYTTLHCGTIRGGTALNIVPRDCHFDFEIRNLPEEDPSALMAEIEAYARDSLLPQMQAVAPLSGIGFEPLSGYPGLDTDPGEKVVTLVKSLAGANDRDKITFGTEGGLFQQRVAIPTVVCGPGSISKAHKPNEWISLEQVALCEAFVSRLIDWLA